MKLPEIDYNPGGVRPLAKQGDEHIKRAAQVEIDLSRTALGAELDKVGKIGAAGVSLAKEKLSADRDLINSQAQIAINTFNIRSRMKAAKREFNNQMLSSAVQYAGQLLDKYLEDRDQQQAGEAKLSLAKDIGQFQMDNVGVGSYSADKLPDGVFGGETTIKNADGSSSPVQLSRHEIYPEMWFKHAQGSIERNSQLIANESLREEFKAMANLDAQSGYLSLLKDATTAQSKELVARQDAQVGALFDEGQYGLAGKYLEETSLPEAKKIEYRSKIGIKSEEVGYHQLLASDNINQLMTTAGALEDKEYKGKLSAESRFSWSQRFKVKAEKLRHTNNDMMIALRSEATDVSRSVLNDMIQGKALDRQNIEQVIGYAVKNDVDPALVHNLRKEAKSLYVNQLFHAVDSSGRANIIQRLDDSATTPEGRMLAQRYARENERITKALREDPMQYAHDQELYKLEPFQPTSPDFWRNRNLQARAVSDRFKVKAPLLTSSEAQVVSDHFEKSTPAQKVELIQSLQKQLGDDAELVLDQVGLKNPSVRVLSLVDPRTATEAMNGASIRKEYPAAVPKRQDLQNDLTDHFGNVLVTNPKMREGLEQFTLDLYASKVAKTGDLSGQYNKKALKESLKEVPLIEYQDQTFIAPQGVDTKAFKSWIKNTEPKALIGGRVPHMQDEEVVKNIRNGNFSMLQASRNEWYLIDKETGRVISTDGQRPFVMKYDPDLPYKGTYGFPYDKDRKKTVGDIIREKIDGLF